jgi:hypothetical protein
MPEQILTSQQMLLIVDIILVFFQKEMVQFPVPKVENISYIQNFDQL